HYFVFVRIVLFHSLQSVPTRRSSDLKPKRGRVRQSTRLRDLPASDGGAAKARLLRDRRRLSWGIGLASGGVILLVFRIVVAGVRSEEHTSELQSRENLVCGLMLEKKK